MDKTIRGLQEAQRWNQRAIANLKPSGEYGRMIRDVTAALQRYMVTITHVRTGALRASERDEVDPGRLRGRVYIDPNARNPRSRARTAVYGAVEDARGGEHAFAARTHAQAGLIVTSRITRSARAYT